MSGIVSISLMSRIVLAGLLLAVVFGDMAAAGPFEDAKKAIRQRDYERAFFLLEPLAKEGKKEAQYQLGVLYVTGRGGNRNYFEAAEWFQLAAKQGVTGAQLQLGVLYLSGRGVQKNLSKASKLISLAAVKNNILAQYILGQMYIKGLGVPRDHGQAATWIRKAASMGHVRGQASLGYLYYKGFGVQKNLRESFKWYLLAANQRDVASMAVLGAFYTTGLGGVVRRNYSTAYMWYTLAKWRGSKKVERYRRTLRRTQSRNTISRGVRLARQWRPRTNGLVKITQQLLIRLGYKIGIADGQIGGATREAIVKYQKSKDLPIDGKITGKMIKLMLADVNGSVPPTVIAGLPLDKEPAKSFDARQGIGSDTRTPNERVSRRAKRKPLGTGTGFVVSKTGHILTNRHVVNNCGSVKLRWADGDEGTARILNISKNADLALLKTSSKVTSVAKFRSGKRLRQGDDIAVYGFPLTGILSASGNLTTGSVAALAGLGDNASLMQISAPVQPGNSGGPVFDKSGRIVGVVVSKLNAVKAVAVLKDIPQNINFAIKASVATNFLEARGVTYEVETGGVERSNADNTDAAKTYTMRLECYR